MPPHLFFLSLFPRHRATILVIFQDSRFSASWMRTWIRYRLTDRSLDSSRLTTRTEGTEGYNSGSCWSTIDHVASDLCRKLSPKLNQSESGTEYETSIAMLSALGVQLLVNIMIRFTGRQRINNLPVGFVYFYEYPDVKLFNSSSPPGEILTFRGFNQNSVSVPSSKNDGCLMINFRRVQRLTS